MVANMDTSEIRELLHRLREPLGTLAIRLELFEREPLSPAAQSNLEAMQNEMKRARETFDEVDFILHNGHGTARSNAGSMPRGPT
jgi:DNA-binding GntR family transcriptional regulator